MSSWDRFFQQSQKRQKGSGRHKFFVKPLYMSSLPKSYCPEQVIWPSPDSKDIENILRRTVRPQSTEQSWRERTEWGPQCIKTNTRIEMPARNYGPGTLLCIWVTRSTDVKSRIPCRYFFTNDEKRPRQQSEIELWINYDE